MADTYRALIRIVGLQVVVAVAGRTMRAPARRAGDTTLIAMLLVAALAGLALVVAAATKGYRLAAALEASAPRLWAVGFLIPGVSALLLLAISARANALCRRYGIQVGLLGPVGDSVDAFAAKNNPR